MRSHSASDVGDIRAREDADRMIRYSLPALTFRDTCIGCICVCLAIEECVFCFVLCFRRKQQMPSCSFLNGATIVINDDSTA